MWIDRGGTFTDCIAVEPASVDIPIRAIKILSSDRSVIAGIRAVLDVDENSSVPPCDVRIGTTVATNALLERRGAATGLVITKGFADLLAIGDQTRPDLFQLAIEARPQLYTGVWETEARLDPTGAVLARPRPEALRAGLQGLWNRGARSLAVVILHAYRNGALEREIGAVAQAVGFEDVTLSHQVAPELGLLGRADTTVAEAYLAPLLARYVDQLRRDLPGCSVRLMQSNGGLTEAESLQGKDAVLSGPAGGAVAVGHVARTEGYPRVLGFDMGGTSTDVCRYEGGLNRTDETRVAGIRLRAPAVAIHTVAAGGGSICRYEDGRLTVGPDSAGAEPGPLCYGSPEARHLTLTDVNLALGRLHPQRFPFALHREPVRAALQAVAEPLADGGDPRGPLGVAEGFFEVAVERMAGAVRHVALDHGHDVRDHALVVFGGAGGQHACAIARKLGIKTLLSHPLAGVMSAFGVGVAPVTRWAQVEATGTALTDDALAPIWDRVRLHAQEARQQVCGESLVPQEIEVRAEVELRYRGTELPLRVDVGQPTEAAPGAAEVCAQFENQHHRRFGYRRPHHPIELVQVRVEAKASPPLPPNPSRPPAAGDAATARAPLWSDGNWLDVPLHAREHLRSGTELRGPALVLEQTGTWVLDAGFVLSVRPNGTFVIRDQEGPQRPSHRSAEVDPVLLEVFDARFTSIAQQMGSVLRRSALSTNIRDRQDFSCALFDREGNLVANAPHIPVHLGAMSESVQAVARTHPRIQPGDVFVTNDPDQGGSHLPDLTVVTPVHNETGSLIFFTANRGHHADIGGRTPGSMPPFSQTLADEGVVFRCERIVTAGRFERDTLRHRLTDGPFPARTPGQNLADLEAQIAANQKGANLLGALVDDYGLDVVTAYMNHTQDHAERCVRTSIAALPDGRHSFADALDDGTALQVTADVLGDTLTIDFAGTSGPVRTNFNAPSAVTSAAVLYFLRTLGGRTIPLNSGCLRPVQLRIPKPSLLAPPPGSAVVAGNVETSQRIVDVLLGAVGRAAASQGTMNNITFGDDQFGYYETVGGGAGAGPDFHGASGVHTHMTNSRITDPEVLESRFPVRLLEFSLRRGSGGEGRFRGGDGLVREYMFLAPVRVGVLSERRVRAPFGLAGGGPGCPGLNARGNQPLPGLAVIDVGAGERVRIETPGGGGYGPA